MTDVDNKLLNIHIEHIKLKHMEKLLTYYKKLLKEDP